MAKIFLREGRLRAIWRVILYLPAYFLLSLASQVLVGIFYFSLQFLASGGGLPTTIEEVPLALFLLSTYAGLVVAIGLTWLFRRLLDRSGFLDLGLRLGKGWAAQTLLGVVLGILLMGFIFAFQWLAGWLQPTGLELAIIPGLLGYFLLFVAVALSEELVFRGYTLQNLREEWGPAPALVVSALLFALFHGLNPNFSWLAFLGIFLAGVLLGYGYLVTGALWLPMGLHFAWNFAEGPLFSFAVSGLAIPGLITWEEGQPDLLWSGGAFGPEGGILGLLASLLGLLLLKIWMRYRRPK